MFDVCRTEKRKAYKKEKKKKKERKKKGTEQSH